MWYKMLSWQGIQRAPMGRQQKVEWTVKYTNGNNAMVEIYRTVMAGSVYTLWQERNLRIFQGKKRRIEDLCKLIIQDTHGRGQWNKKLAGRLSRMNFYP